MYKEEQKSKKSGYIMATIRQGGAGVAYLSVARFIISSHPAQNFSQERFCTLFRFLKELHYEHLPPQAKVLKEIA